MQQHTGQHLLSAVIAERFGAATVSVHFGRESSTLDLDTATFSHAQAVEAEALANVAVAENRAVEVSFEEAADAAGLRKASDRDGHAADRDHRGARPERLRRHPRPRDRRDRPRSPFARSSG